MTTAEPTVLGTSSDSARAGGLAATAPGRAPASDRRCRERLAAARAQYLLAGLVVGSVASASLSEPLRAGMRAGSFLLIAWMGLTLGLGLDRQSRGTGTRGRLLAPALQSGAAALAGLVLIWSYAMLVPAAGLTSEAALIVAGLAAAMAPSIEAATTVRGARGLAPGPRLAVSGCLAVALAGAGRLLLHAQPVAVRLPWVGEPNQALVAQGVGTLLVWCLAVGAGTGLLADLLTRGPRPGQLPALALAALAVGTGVGVAFGMDPIWVGLAAGAWWINATLRRGEVLYGVRRLQAPAAIALYCVAGWQVGDGIGRAGFVPGAFAAVLLATGLAAPLAAWGGRRLGTRLRVPGSLPDALSGTAPGPVGLGPLGIALALGLAEAVGGAAGASGLAGVLVAHLLACLGPGPAEPAEATA